MSINPRGSGFQWYRRIDGIRYREQFATKAEAERWDHIVSASLLAGEGVPERPKDKEAPAAGTLQELADETYAKFWKDLAHGQAYRHKLNAVVKVLGPSRSAAEIDDDAVEEFVEGLEDAGNSNGTINRKLAALSKMLRYGVRKGKLEKMPHIDRKPEGGGRIRWLTDDEEKAVLGTLLRWEKLDHVDAVTVLLDTGLRPSELYRLRAQDVDQKTGMLTIWQSKNGKPRSVKMTRRVREVFKRRKGPAPFPFDNMWMRHTWDRVRTHLGYTEDPHFVPYICRHTCASRLAQRGVRLQVIMEWLGHSSTAMTMRYAHLSPSSLDEAALALEAA
jgi:integrase